MFTNENLACLYVAIKNKHPIPDAILQEYRARLEISIVSDSYNTEATQRRRQLYGRVWCYIVDALSHVDPVCTLEQISNDTNQLAPELVASFVVSTGASQAKYSIEPVVIATQSAASGEYGLSELGAQLCVGWLHRNLVAESVRHAFYSQNFDDLAVSDAITARLSKSLSTFLITENSRVYDRCFFTRLGLLLNTHQAAAFEQHSRPFRALEAFHHAEVNDNYSRVQNSDLYHVLTNTDNHNDIEWGIIAAYTLEHMMLIYDDKRVTLLRTDICVPSPTDKYIWLDLDRKQLVTCRGRSCEFYDRLLCEHLLTEFADSTITKFIFQPHTLCADHAILKLLQC